MCRHAVPLAVVLVIWQSYGRLLTWAGTQIIDNEGNEEIFAAQPTCRRVRITSAPAVRMRTLPQSPISRPGPNPTHIARSATLSSHEAERYSR